jgi:hypothetical protein
MDQLQTLLQQQQDSRLHSLGKDAARQMTVALGHLEHAISEQAEQPLRMEFDSEQAAYASLLKLREREHEVAMSMQQSGGGGGANSRSQRQLDNLQLKNEENRYQMEQQARAETESAQQREDRQILNRLRELARRQNDLNQRLRELQTALEKAEAGPEKQELSEQLKRLQQEQEQILRDAEELQQRLDSADNRARMNEQSQQLQQAREDIQQANESLQQSDVSSAAAEGTRAQRQLRDLRDEFQTRASGQFDDRIQQIRNSARDLESEQQQISEELDGEQNNNAPRSLSENSRHDELPQRMRSQSQRVRNLQQEMQQLVVESEGIEPIMAERLYDAWRESQQTRPDDALDNSAQSIQRGLVDDARALNGEAAQGIEKLREGVDQAAEAVLGDEAEALRRASSELQRLASELENEAQRAQGGGQNKQADQATEANAQSGEPSSQSDTGAATESRNGAPDGKTTPAGSDTSSEPPSSASQNDENQVAPESLYGRSASQDGANRPSTGGTAGSGDGRRRGDRPPAGQPPSLDNRNTPDSRGRAAADPRLNYDNSDDWLRPLSGNDYTDWMDRLRDVENMVADPQLRAEASRIREEARTIRGEVRRHSQPPNWELVDMKVLKPLVELQDRVHEELLRQTDQKSLVPIDRDPVPPEFEDAVRQYYEQLGRGQR